MVRNRGLSILNRSSSLAAGMAVAVLTGLWIDSEVSFFQHSFRSIPSPLSLIAIFLMPGIHSAC